MTTLSKLFSKARSLKNKSKTPEQDAQDRDDFLQSKPVGLRPNTTLSLDLKLKLSPLASEGFSEMADLYGVPERVLVEMVVLKFLDEHGYRVEPHRVYSTPFSFYLEGRRGRLTSSLHRNKEA